LQTRRSALTEAAAIVASLVRAEARTICFIKSRKATTSNWAHPRLSESQLLYAANDAWAALRIYRALGERPATAAS